MHNLSGTRPMPINPSQNSNGKRRTNGSIELAGGSRKKLLPSIILGPIPLLSHPQKPFFHLLSFLSDLRGLAGVQHFCPNKGANKILDYQHTRTKREEAGSIRSEAGEESSAAGREPSVATCARYWWAGPAARNSLYQYLSGKERRVEKQSQCRTPRQASDGSVKRRSPVYCPIPQKLFESPLRD